MVLGTASHVGKSILTAALGRILSNDGYRVAPFKAQNMSLNSAATPDGREIGRAQALQAEACRVTPRVEMNPVLIKPSTDTSAQVVVQGRVWGQMNASDYFRRRVETLFPVVVDCHRTLAREHDIVLLEGAGSPAEINLKARDIVNMRMAIAARAACVLVADIDRGGAFASLVGTLALLDEDERRHIRAFIINRFRGDLSLLMPGVHAMEERLGIPCAGVVPFLPSLGLDEEDGVSLEDRRTARPWFREPGREESDRKLRVGVIAFPYMSNFTDFDALAAEPDVSLAFLDRPEDVALADVLILPGSKQTLADLQWFRSGGFERALGQPALLIGICGGMQMLGLSIHDDAAEGGSVAHVIGLGLLPVRTRLLPEKITRRAAGHITDGVPISGYEIHLGETAYEDGAVPFARIRREGDTEQIDDGAVSPDHRIFGTYLHGLFDDDNFRHAFLGVACSRAGVRRPQHLTDVTAAKDARIERLATHVRSALDMSLIYRLLEWDAAAEMESSTHAVV